ncbi:hypothetical protein B0H10DRAFT_2053468 [Mycena sp. CBHHK59/15]|nr:hypothetical protein B0H10DRAFT_2053468 [Mycena sp. CBHHK59/15]
MSLLTVALTQTIPVQALVTWDQRLLVAPRACHLVFLIAGFGDVYPALSPAGVLLRPGGAGLRFQVGVCVRYKPDRAAAVEAGHTFGLVGRDTEDEVHEAQDRAARQREAVLARWEDGGEDTTIAYAEEEDEGEGRFERFSLSVGWAGAELMYAKVERDQCGNVVA